MKITKKQRTEIIKKAGKNLIEWDYLCISLALAISSVLDVDYIPEITNIQEYFPKFDKSTAIKYFHARNEYTWWDSRDRQTRLRFLRYLLTGKLSKVRK
jgi:hypothetical protein